MCCSFQNLFISNTMQGQSCATDVWVLIGSRILTLLQFSGCLQTLGAFTLSLQG